MANRLNIGAPTRRRRRPDARDASAEPQSWDARPGLARAIRVIALLGPILVGCVAAIAANRWIPMPHTVAVAVVRSLGIVGVATGVVWGVDRFARRVLPLAALMQLSLVFPDQAPSRFKSALKSGSSRRLERTLEQTRTEGLADDPGEAARQVIQLIGAIGDHDRRTRGHSERVRLYTDLIGEELKLSKEERQKLQWGALLHDLGKLMVPGEILNKAGKPDADEWRILQSHPDEGMRLIEPLRDFLGEWVHAIGGHHEKWDGSGYPNRLDGPRIPRAAAIVAVADSFEVMTAVRSYKKAMPLAEARAELTRCAGTHFSPEVVRAFLQISLGHLRIVSGPLAALAHLPFLGQLSQLPAAAASVLPTAASAAMPAAAMVTAAALTVGAPAAPTELAFTAATPAAAHAQPVPTSTPTSPSAASEKGSTPVAGGSAPAAAQAAAPAPSPAGAPVAPTATTTTAAAVAATPPAAAPTPVTAAQAAPSTAPSPTTTWNRDRHHHHGGSPNPTWPTPTTNPPGQGSPWTPSTVIPSMTFAIQVSTSSLRIPSRNLDGATFPRGTRLYVFAPAMGVSRIRWTYPAGSNETSSFPYDMRGGSFTANSWTAPSTPGTYTITADAEGGIGSPAPVTATFTIT
ncbi:MAG: HD-GYP domain-containing protein [Microthrixaceae bacterium]